MHALLTNFGIIAYLGTLKIRHHDRITVKNRSFECQGDTAWPPETRKPCITAMETWSEF
jgi:hypothetical protein